MFVPEWNSKLLLLNPTLFSYFTQIKHQHTNIQDMNPPGALPAGSLLQPSTNANIVVQTRITQII